MPNYRPDPNSMTSSKQIPGPLPDNHFDRVADIAPFSMSKQPTFVHVISAPGMCGFFFGRSASFSEKATTETSNPGIGCALTGSQHYVQFNSVAAGQYHMNPIAFSGSAADTAKIKFFYKGGLDGLGRP